ncbi:hypothetical protein GQ42DRAFT_160655, partial [Ramicandelaber brevisporus]
MITRSSSQLVIWLQFFVLRLLMALYLCRTYINPDETWQSLEIAHNRVFGYGFRAWEWRHEDHPPIRGYAHPFLFSLAYRALAALGLDDTRDFITVVPGVIVALFASIIDWSTIKLAQRLWGENSKAVWWSAFCSVTSITLGTVLMRPIVNAAETATVGLALAFWPWSTTDGSPRAARWRTRDYAVALSMAAAGCILRPTTAVLWLFLGGHLLVTNMSRFRDIFLVTVLIGAVSVSAMMLIDYHYYGKWVFVPLAFYDVNVRQNLSIWFGSHPFYWYVVAGLPSLAMPALLPAIAGAIFAPRYTRPLTYASIWLVGVYSLLAHKEARFLACMLPIIHVFAGYALSGSVAYTAGELGAKWQRFRDKYIKLITAAFIISGVPVIIYLNLVHQRGVVDVMHFLRHAPKVTEVGFLMPCHSTPFHSHVHRKDVEMWFLGCEPPLHGKDHPTFTEESDDFTEKPQEFVQKRAATWYINKIKMGRPFPSHLVVFDNVVPKIMPVLIDHGYRQCARFFNTHFHPEPRRSGDVVVLC